MAQRRRFLLQLGAACMAVAASRLGGAQGAKLPRVGVLSARARSTPSDPDPYFDAFVRGMRELGYVEGKNLAIEWRFANDDYERLPALAEELVRSKVEVIVTHATPPLHALSRTTTTIPIVMTSVTDPVGGGFATSLARPNRNITGIASITADMGEKYVELLKTMLPSLVRVGVLLNPGTSFHTGMLKTVQGAARSRNVEVLPVGVRNAGEIASGFEGMARKGAGAAIILNDSVLFAQRRQIAELALRHRIATLGSDREQVIAGSLISYGSNVTESYRRAAIYVDKILKGAKPGDLPIEQPTNIYLAINRRTAQALGLSIPNDLRLRADVVVE